MRALAIGAGLVGIALVGGCAASSKTAAKDVTITVCRPSPGGGRPTASGRIVNHSSKASVYTVHVKFKDSAGNGVGDGLTAVAHVEPGATRDLARDRNPQREGARYVQPRVRDAKRLAVARATA